MHKKELISLGFKHDAVHNEYYYERKDIEGIDEFGSGKFSLVSSREDRAKFKPNDSYRCEFLRSGIRIGKIHYDAIRLIYDNGGKPVLEICIQGGAKMSIKKEEISIWGFEPIEDFCFLRHIIPTFDVVSFYGCRPNLLEMDIKLTELRPSS